MAAKKAIKNVTLRRRLWLPVRQSHLILAFGKNISDWNQTAKSKSPRCSSVLIFIPILQPVSGFLASFPSAVWDNWRASGCCWTCPDLTDSWLFVYIPPHLHLLCCKCHISRTENRFVSFGLKFKNGELALNFGHIHVILFHSHPGQKMTENPPTPTPPKHKGTSRMASRISCASPMAAIFGAGRGRGTAAWTTRRTGSHVSVSNWWFTLLQFTQKNNILLYVYIYIYCVYIYIYTVYIYIMVMLNGYVIAIFHLCSITRGQLVGWISKDTNAPASGMRCSLHCPPWHTCRCFRSNLKAEKNRDSQWMNILNILGSIYYSNT